MTARARAAAPSRAARPTGVSRRNPTTHTRAAAGGAGARARSPPPPALHYIAGTGSLLLGSHRRPASAAAAATVASAPAALAPPTTRGRAGAGAAAAAAAGADENEPEEEAPADFLAKYALGELLGRGASAAVHVAIDRQTGQLAAVKLLRRHAGGGGGGRGGRPRRDRSAALASEAAACAALQPARHAARLHGLFASRQGLAIVSELCAGGDLADLLASSPGGRLDEREAARAVRTALEFLADSHGLGFVVGDVKPANFALRRLYPSARHLADPEGHPDRGVLDVAAVDFGCCVDYASAVAGVGAGLAAGTGAGAAAAGAAAAGAPAAGEGVEARVRPFALGAASFSSRLSPSPASSPGASMASLEDELCVLLPSPLSSPPRSPPASSSPSPASSGGGVGVGSVGGGGGAAAAAAGGPPITGTPVYMGPEVLRGCASPASDVWACGVTLYELLTGAFPFWREPAAGVAALGARAITEGIRHGPVLFPRDPFCPDPEGGAGGLRPSVQDLLLGMLRRDPARRLSAQEALAHPWFAEVLGGDNSSSASPPPPRAAAAE